MKKTAKHDKEVNSNLSLIFKTSVIVFLSMAFSKILSYAYRVIIARQFGPEVYGLFSIGLMIAGWFIAISALGLSEGILRFIPFYRARNQKAKISKIFRFTLLVLLIAGILAGT